MQTPLLFSARGLSLKKTLIFLVLALILMLLDTGRPSWLKNVRVSTHSAMQPIYQGARYPSFFFGYVQDLWQSKEALRRDNARLRAEVLANRARLQTLDYATAQNNQLLGVLSTSAVAGHDLRLAKVIGTDSNPTKQVVVLDKGATDGVQIGQTVVDERGILGQIINVYPNTSRLLLISDEEQAVAVNIARTDRKSVV